MSDVKRGFHSRVTSPRGGRTGSSQRAVLAVFAVICSEISASRDLSAAEILAVLRRRVGENSGDAGCYLAVVRCTAAHSMLVSTVFDAFVTTLVTIFNPENARLLENRLDN